jgi:hypothetical protein
VLAWQVLSSLSSTHLDSSWIGSAKRYQQPFLSRELELSSRSMYIKAEYSVPSLSPIVFDLHVNFRLALRAPTLQLPSCLPALSPMRSNGQVHLKGTHLNLPSHRLYKSGAAASIKCCIIGGSLVLANTSPTHMLTPEHPPSGRWPQPEVKNPTS